MSIADQLEEAMDVADLYRDGQEFVKGFYRRHPSLRSFKPKVNATSEAGGGAHPEARLKGDKVYLFEKFWDLDDQTKDFVFAHELGHYAARKGGLPKVASQVGIDVWDTSSLPFSQFNYEEAFADAFATYYLDRSELKRRYPRWLDLVEVVIGKKKPGGNDRVEELTQYAERAYQNASQVESDPRQRAEMTAITVGRQAKRMGLSPGDVQKWLQSAYGKVWVIGGRLNPGMDLKEVWKLIQKAMR